MKCPSCSHLQQEVAYHPSLRESIHAIPNFDPCPAAELAEPKMLGPSFIRRLVLALLPLVLLHRFVQASGLSCRRPGEKWKLKKIGVHQQDPLNPVGNDEHLLRPKLPRRGSLAADPKRLEFRDKDGKSPERHETPHTSKKLDSIISPFVVVRVNLEPRSLATLRGYFEPGDMMWIST